MNGVIRLGSDTEEDLSHAALHLLVGPRGVERALVRSAHPPGQPVEALGLAQPLGRRHRAVELDLLG